MANLLGILVTWATFPGVILHEWGHKFFCDRAGIPVYEVKYFGFGDPAGYVRHGEITRYRDAFLVTIAPFIINSIFAIAMFILPVFKVNGTIDLFFMWLGASFAMHAFPSDGDAKHLWAHSQSSWRANPVALIGFPLVIVIFIANLLRIFWFDLIYAVVLFGFTFGLVGAVIYAGSTLTGLPVPDTPPTHPAPSVTSAYSGSGGSAPHAYGSSSQPPTRAPAKDWLPVADAAMKRINSSAVLVYIHGDSATAVDGRCREWWYQYVLPDKTTTYNVFVRDGVLERASKSTFSPNGKDAILSRGGDPNNWAWSLDSMEAVAAANDKYRGMTGKGSPGSAAYILEVSSGPINKGRLTWRICYYNPDSSVNADISIDAQTGAVVSADTR